LTLRAAVPLYGAIFQTSGLLRCLFWAAQASQGSSGHVMLVLLLLTSGLRFSKRETHFWAENSGPWYTRLMRIRFYACE